MMLGRISKRDKKLLLGVLIFLLSLFIYIKSDITKAAPKPVMEDGKIIIEIESKAASSNIRYRTIGYTISTKKAPETAYAKGRTGPATPPNPKEEKLFDQFEKKELYRDKETVRTQYTLSEDKVKALMKSIIDLDQISENTILYFNAIFQTYKIVDGKEVILNPKITTWQGIVNDQSWTNVDVFTEYFNIPLEFKPGLQPNSLYYDLEGSIQRQGELESKKINETVEWKDEQIGETYNYKGTIYTLKGYYAKTKLTGEEIVRKMVGGSTTVNDIINDSVKVLYGGMDIYMIYKPTTVDIRIDAQDIDTGKDIKTGLYTGTKEPGEIVNERIDTVITVDGITYSKTTDFYFLYDKSDGSRAIYKDKTSKEEDPIKFQVPLDAKTPSKIIVKVYYKKATPGSIPVTVKAINADTKAELQTLITESVLAGENYRYTVNEVIKSGGKTYDFTGEWKWQYKKNTSSAPTVTNSGKGKDISFKVPSADEISGGITVNIYYNPGDTATDEIDLRVIMVSKTGTFIEEISREVVSPEQSINKSIQSIRMVGSLTYHYQDKWDYTYITASGDNTKIGSGSTASFKVPSDTKLGTVITLRLYYDASQSVEVPEPSPPIVLPIDSPSPYAVIDGDKYGSQYFISKQGISTTESQHVYVKTKDYLLGYRLVNKTGKITLVVPVTMTYTLRYYTATPEEFGGPQEVIDTVTDTQYIPVEKAYSYWEIASLEYYTPSSANVYNYSLPNGEVKLRVNSSYLNVPSLSTRHSSNRDDHIIFPKQVTEGIHLTYDTPITSDDGYRPHIEYIDLTPYALEMTEELKVKNDYLVFNGSLVMSDVIAEKIAPRPNASTMVHSNKITHDKALFTEGQIIDALKKNGVYSSNGNVTYQRHPMSVNAFNSSKSFNLSVNDVFIHTPVICDPIINSDNDKWVQLLNPTEGAYHMVLDPDTSLNDFTVRISNKLPHSNRLGYYERDFSRSFIDPENVSYIAKKDGIVRNEMKLPFDVYIDTYNDNNPENDDLIKAGTWIVLGRETHRFYVPMWVQEGVYTAQFRTVAVNGEGKLSNTETTRNTNINNYVATATRTFQISGRIYGFTLYDISDEGRWKDVFRIKDTMMFKYFEGAVDGTKRANYHDDYAYYYTVGIKNQYGYQTGRNNKFTLPLINGSHPKYRNVGALKTGYAFRFMLDTTGEMYGSGCKIRIIPTFYHVDENGKSRQQVDIYYDEEFNGKHHALVKIGEGIDLTNIQQGLVGNPYSRIPEKELRHTAKVLDTTYSKITNQLGAMYSYSDIRISNKFRTFIGLDYAKHISSLPSYKRVKELTKETELSLSKYMQRWYGTYKLPTNIHVVPAGYDVYGYLRKHGINYSENFWLKDGYIIVNFLIETYDKNEKRHLSYNNGYYYTHNNHCSMWVMEGGNTEKTDNNGSKFRLYAGDVVFYHTSKKHSDDYIGRLY